MSAPRRVVPGVTYLLTRRCFGRLFLLRPSRKLNQIFEFCLAVASARTGCLVHSYSALSNHYHLVVTDVRGNLPEFMHWFNEYVAKCVNVELGRWESFWAPGSYSAVALVDKESVMRALVYSYTNPVEARLVRSHKQWPGANSLPAQMGDSAKVIDRPTGFFRANGPVPESASLKLVPPPIFGRDRKRWLPELLARIAAREAKTRAEVTRRGVGFLGRRRVLRQSPKARPKNAEPRRGLNPRVATRDKWRRIEVLQRLKQFLVDYRAAWLAFARGDRSVAFPSGTYAMQVRFKVTCHGP